MNDAGDWRWRGGEREKCRRSDKVKLTAHELHAKGRGGGRHDETRYSRSHNYTSLLPSHNHPIEVVPASGLSVYEAVQKLKPLTKSQIPDCWERICGIKERDFSQM